MENPEVMENPEMTQNSEVKYLLAIIYEETDKETGKQITGSGKETGRNIKIKSCKGSVHIIYEQ